MRSNEYGKFSLQSGDRIGQGFWRVRLRRWYRPKRADSAGLDRWHGHRERLPVGVTAQWGFTVLDLPSREEAIAWAARLAKACRCDQELRVFGFDPSS